MITSKGKFQLGCLNPRVVLFIYSGMWKEKRKKVGE
jgi:hypothetical protein